MPRKVKSDLEISAKDIDVIENVFDHGLELLDAANEEDSTYFIFEPLTHGLMTSLRSSGPLNAEGMNFAVYLLDLASDAVSGKLFVAPELRAALAPDIFAINRIHDRWKKVLDNVPRSHSPATPTFGFSYNLSFPGDDNWADGHILH